MDKIHREVVTNISLNHAYFTKIVFIEGKSEKSLEILNFLMNLTPPIFVHEYPRMEYSKKNVNENFIECISWSKLCVETAGDYYYTTKGH